MARPMALRPGARLLLGCLCCWRLAWQCGAPAVPLEDLGPCACDLTSGSCDADCCCDPDCGALAQTFDCLPEGPASATAQLCHSKEWVTRINPRVDMWVVADDLRSLLCVEVDNSQVKGVFYTNSPTQPAAAIADTMAEHQQTTFSQAIGVGGATGTQTQNRPYQIGDILTVHMALNTQSEQIEPFSSLSSGQREIVEIAAALRLQTPGMFGGCSLGSGGQPARFLANLPGASCWLDQSLEALCSTALNPSLVTSWRIPRQLLATSQRCGTGDSCLQPEVSVADQEGNTVELRDSIFSKNGQVCSCTGAVEELRYSFYFDSSGAITAAQVGIALHDIRDVPCDGSPVAHRSSVRFLQGPQPGNAAKRSGNPGYVVGLPLMASKCQEYDESGTCSIFEPPPQAPRVATVDGVSTLGDCVEVGSAAMGWDIALNFGEDAAMGCTLALTRAELEEACTSENGFSSRLQLLRVLGPPRAMSGSWTHLAAWGSVVADSQEPEDWVEVVFDSVTELPQFTQDAQGALESRCQGAIVGLDLQLLYSPFGEVGNPQDKIVAARATHRVGVLHYTRKDPLEPQRFQFTFMVSFARLDTTEEPQVETPPRAQLPLLLPQDLFYPFGLGSGAAQGATGVGGRHALVRAASFWLLLLVVVTPPRSD